MCHPAVRYGGTKTRSHSGADAWETYCDKPIPEHCIVHTYEGGVVIQAGPHPEFGNANSNSNLEAYRAVEKLLTPLRFESYDVGLFPVPSPRDSLTETLEWVRRFTA